ncbi:hypothetical protein WG922_21645 [Ramlibacter sp. AN1015]|uniref:hypothetical protein n=1 Tax=Ramlibacter sp. AN1015 TaxID=3133428 RepID=UPI0030C34186
MLYSASTRGFYSRDIHKAIPADAVEVSAQAYAALMAGQAQGQQIEPDANGAPALAAAPVVSSVPQVVSKFQAKAALHAAGLLASVETLMAGADAVTRLAWTEAQEFRRQSPTVAAMGAALGLDDAALDALFTTAAGIEA